MAGFVNLRVSLVLRRAVTMIPALVVLAIGVSPTSALVLSQVVLSFGIPFALVPLVLLTRRSDVMGSYVNKRAHDGGRDRHLRLDQRAQRLPALSADRGLTPAVPGSRSRRSFFVSRISKSSPDDAGRLPGAAGCYSPYSSVSSHSRQTQSPVTSSRALNAAGTIVTPHTGQIGGRSSSALRQVAERVDRRAVHAHLEVQVRTGAEAGAAGVADHVALRDVLVAAHRDARLVPVRGREAVVVVDDDEVPVAGLPAAVDDRPRRGSVDRRALGNADVDARDGSRPSAGRTGS